MEMRPKYGFCAAVAAFGLTFGAASAHADPARGLALAGHWCSQCHGVRPNEASLSPAIPTFPEIAAEPSATELSLRVFLRTPHPSMPNFILERDDTDDLVDYILSLKGPGG